MIPIEKFSAITGCLTDASDMQPFMHEWRGRITGKAGCVLLPKNTHEVSEIVKLCAQHKIAIVPQGGNTGLVGASVPDETGEAVCLSLKRMSAIRHIEADDFSMVAEAGCILQNAKDAAAAKARLLAMTLPSEGSATIGGLIATNAGGAFTLRYGNIRAQVLGLEAVLPDGRIWQGLRSLHKNNSGYDLKQLLIGSEGTLGVITAATLRLLPLPTQNESALIALESPQDAIAALGELRRLTQDRLAAFELMPQLALETAGKGDVFSARHPWAALIETHERGENTPALLPDILGALLEKNLIRDAVVAESTAQAKAFWNVREAIVGAQKQLGASLKHDLAVPVGHIPALIMEGSALVEKLVPGVRPYLFGHVGDGNIHFNLSQPDGLNKEFFLAQRDMVASALHDLVLRLGGSISAEHGIGRFKRDEFHRTVDRVEFDTMRKIKTALDPDGIMNPGVIF